MRLSSFSVATMILHWSDMLDFLSCGQFFFQIYFIICSFFTNGHVIVPCIFGCFYVSCKFFLFVLFSDAIDAMRDLNCSLYN